MHKAVEKLTTCREKDSITGVVITSAKRPSSPVVTSTMITAGRRTPARLRRVQTSRPTCACWRRSGSPSSRPSTARRSAAAWRSRRRATTASPPTSRAARSDCFRGVASWASGGGGVPHRSDVRHPERVHGDLLSQGTRIQPPRRPRRAWSTSWSVPLTRSFLQPPKRGSKPTRRHTQPWDAKGLQRCPRHPWPARHWPPSAVVPVAAAQTIKDAPKSPACAAGHHGRRGRGCAGGLRHRQPDRSRCFTSWSPRPDGRQRT